MARSTMGTLITELRGMVDAGTADYTIGAVAYWTDDQLQTHLDASRVYINHEAIEPIANYGTAGAITYTIYPTGITWLEDTVTIQDTSGATVGTANYSIDLLTGVVTFTSDTAGVARYITGYSYNLFQAAYEVWKRKAAHYAGAYDVSTDNHSLKRSQLVSQAREMARTYAELASAGMSVTLDRTDGA